MVRCIDAAREHIPEYASGDGPTKRDRLDVLTRSFGVRIRFDSLDHPSLLIPVAVGGWRYLLLDSELHRPTIGFVVRHELGHLANGDAEEGTHFHFNGPLPECETVADLFAFADLISSEDCAQGVEWVAEMMRDLVTLDYEPWYRRLEIDRLPSQLIRLRIQLDSR